MLFHKIKSQLLKIILIYQVNKTMKRKKMWEGMEGRQQIFWLLV